MDREREREELSAYVRTLADRMGLTRRTFEVRFNDDDDGESYPPCFYDEPDGSDRDGEGAAAVLVVGPGYFAATPERQRSLLMEELVRVHSWPFRMYAFGLLPEAYNAFVFEDRLEAMWEPLLAAWAAALPLPPAGLMRRAAPALAREED